MSMMSAGGGVKKFGAQLRSEFFYQLFFAVRLGEGKFDKGAGRRAVAPLVDIAALFAFAEIDRTGNVKVRPFDAGLDEAANEPRARNRTARAPAAVFQIRPITTQTQ